MMSLKPLQNLHKNPPKKLKTLQPYRPYILRKRRLASGLSSGRSDGDLPVHRDEGARSRSNHRLPLPTNIRILLAVQGNQLKKIVGLGTVGNKKIIGFWGVGFLLEV